MLHEELTHEIIKAFYEVHKILGFGFLEQVYQNALYKELCYRGMKVECQKEILVHYKGETVGRYIADMLVENRVILGLKAVQALSCLLYTSPYTGRYAHHIYHPATENRTDYSLSLIHIWFDIHTFIAFI